ncbi:MAG: amidohydrolase [Bacteroidaceae bacterium]|nr:amidohydrolase [Bacteroidaceae bacterium]
MKRIPLFLPLLAWALLTNFASLAPLSAKPRFALKELLPLVNAQDDYLRDVRRHLHLHPELGGQELETARYLKAELQKAGPYELHDVAGSTGFYAVLDTHREGPTIGLRTDIDGLPILEKPTNGGGKAKRWVSQNPNVTQGCGHDAHMAILLSTARILAQLKEKLTGRYVLIFEEGEETNTGIRPMIAALRKFRFDVIYGNHVSVAVPSGQLYVQEGPIMAGMATLAFHVNGQGGHASRPDKVINPIPAAAEIVGALGQAWQNQRDITQTVTLGIAQIEGGKAYNVLPNSVFVGGTMRFFNREEGEKAIDIVKRVSENVAAAHRCTVNYDSVMQVNLPPVVNDTLYTRQARSHIEELFPHHVVTGTDYVWYASETFALYKQLAPTVFVHVGIRNEQLGTTAAHHTDQFDLDDDALHYGLGAMLTFAVNFQPSENRNH